MPQTRLSKRERCRLCRRRRPLMLSHLMGAALYRMSRDPRADNPNPVMVTRQTTVSTCLQIRSRLLCSECEQRFNRNGEHWMMAQVFDGNRFPLLERPQGCHSDSREPNRCGLLGTRHGCGYSQTCLFRSQRVLEGLHSQVAGSPRR